MPPYGIDSLLNRNFDAEGFFESPVESIYDPAFGTLNYQTAYGPAPYTGNIPLTSYRVQPGIEYLSDVDGRFKNLGFQGDSELPSFGGSGNPRFNQFGKDIDFINAPQDIYPEAVPPDFINAPQDIYPLQTTGIMKKLPLDMNRFQGVSDMSIIDETTNDEQDQNYIDQVSKNKSTGIMDLIMSIAVPGYGVLKNLGSNFKQDPRATNMRNFYGSEYGLTNTGQVASGIMKGYNPVSGGFLNMITGGRYGRPTNYGLANAARERINKIANRKIAQTDASRAKIKELQDFARADTTSRARQANPDVYKEAERRGFTNAGGGFKSAGTNENFSNKTGRGRTGY